MVHAISPNYYDIDFPSGLSLDQKIEVFSDRVNGWQIYIAQKCVDTIPHSGFAVLHIICSYFEAIAKYKDGYKRDGRSEEYFKKGFEDVFQASPFPSDEVKERVLRKFYKDVRCGLYHAAATGHGIELSDDYNFAVGFATPPERIQINPHQLVPGIKNHFISYIRQLRDNRNEELRRNFEARFNFYHKSV